MKLSLNFAGREFSLGATKSLSVSLANWAKGGDLDTEGAKLTSPYAQSAWVYIAVSRLAEKVASIPFRISRMGDSQARRVRSFRGSSDPRHRNLVRRALGETIIESGDVVDLFNRPHPYMSRQLFWEMVVTWNALRGEFFILPADNMDQPVDMAVSAPRVQRLLTLPPENFWHMVEGHTLAGWRFTGSPLASPMPSEVLLPGEVIHSRSPNPYLFWRGMSPLVVAMIAAGADFAASKYNQGYWLNNADTGLIVTTDQWLDDAQRATIITALRERKRKAGTPDRPLFLGGGTKIEKPQLSGMEQDFIANRKMNRQEILAIFKMSDSVIGLNDAKSSSLSGGGSAINSEQLQFIEGTIGPLCAQLEAAVEPVIKSFGPGLCGWFDLDSLAVMQDARRERLDTATKAFGIGFSRNEVNACYDLGFPEDPTGDKRYLAFSLQEVGATESLPGEDDPRPAPKDEEKSNPFARMLKLITAGGAGVPASLRKPNTTVLWNAHVQSRRKTVKLMQAKVGKVLTHYRGEVLAKLNEVHFKKDAKPGELRIPGEQRSLADIIFNAQAFGAALFAELSNPIAATLQLAGDELHKELGLDDPWKMPPKKAQQFLADRKQAIQGCGQTVRDQLNTALQAGLELGETTSELAGRVRTVFNDLTQGEAKRVAQTEVNMAYNDARHDAMTDAGIEYKAWLSSHGPNVREAHAAAEEATIDNPIPLSEPFEVGGEQLMFPGDDSLGASAGNIINCQCIQLAAQKKSEDEKSVTFKVCGLGELNFPKL